MRNHRVNRLPVPQIGQRFSRPRTSMRTRPGGVPARLPFAVATISGFSHLSLSVTDLDRSTEWYCETLGFDVNSRVENESFRRIRLHHPDAGITVTLTAHEANPRQPFDERRTGMDHVSFAVPTIDDLHALKSRFEDRGVDHSEVKPIAGGAGGMITFRDPDNIQLEVFAAG